MTNPSDAATGTSPLSARITRIPMPVASPGHCAICGKHEHPEGFAATDNFDFDFFGTVYFCADCVGDYARVFGYISEKDLIGLREHIDAQNQELTTLRLAVLGLESTVDGLIADAHRRSTQRSDAIATSRGDVNNDSIPDDSVVQPDEGHASSDVGEPTQVSEGPSNGPDEQGSERRRDDVFDTSSADELLGL